MTGRRVNDLKEEIGMQFSLTGRTVRSQMLWIGDRRTEEGRLQREQAIFHDTLHA